MDSDTIHKFYMLYKVLYWKQKMNEQAILEEHEEALENVQEAFDKGFDKGNLKGEI